MAREDLIRDIGKDMDIIPEEQADNIPEAHKVKFEFHDIHKRRIYKVTQKGIPPPKTGIVKGAVTWVKGLFQDDKSKDMAYTGFESSRHR